jgi:hypothetical protein
MQIPEDFRDYCESIDLDGLPLGSDFEHECSFAYDVGTGVGRKLGQDLRRNYPALTPTEIPGTPDVIRAVPGNLLEVWDYKFEAWESFAPRPADNAQLAFPLLATGAVGGIVHLVHFGPDGERWTESAELDELDVDTWRARFARILAAVRAAEAVVSEGKAPDVSRGEWCRFCPAMAHCPAIGALIRKLVAEPADAGRELENLLTPETAAAAYRRLKEAQAVLGFAGAALYAYAQEHPIDLGGGEWFGGRVLPYDDIDAERAWDVLERLHGAKVAREAMRLKTSRTAIDRALGPVAKAAKAAGHKVTKKAMTEQAMAELGQAGAIAHGTRIRTEVYRLAEGGQPQALPAPPPEGPPVGDGPPAWLDDSQH